MGITVRVRPRAHHADLEFRSTTMATPDPLGFLADAGGPSPPVPRPAPGPAAALARRVDTELAADADVIAFGTPAVGELASASLGCRTSLPLSFGDDLTRLCPGQASR